jgi:hypothetical protein
MPNVQISLDAECANLTLLFLAMYCAGVRWASEAGFSKDQVEEFKQLLGLVENVFIDHDAIKDSKKIAGEANTFS